MAKPLSMPLPPSWPRLVKSALLHALGLERLALAEVRAGFESSPDPRAQMLAEIDRLRDIVEIQAEELRILRARFERIPAHKRPHCPPADRLAIVMLRARAGWNAAETARRFLFTSPTIASWMRRLDEQGPEALLQTPEPVNRYDDHVTLVTQQLHQAAPNLGRRQLADLLSRAGLHLASSTVRRMLRKKTPTASPPEPKPTAESDAGEACGHDSEAPQAPRVVTAKYPHHVYHVDISIVPSFGGFWVPWLPFALVCWPLAWWVVAVLDHCSRAVLARGVFKKEPTAGDVCRLLDAAAASAGRAPRHIVSDRGAQFGSAYRAWCERNGVKPRFGALGQHGSIAVIERWFRTLKAECFAHIVVPLSESKLLCELDAYLHWYHVHRPHASLLGATPAEVLQGVVPACTGKRLEPRRRYPLARGDPTAPLVHRDRKLELIVTHVEGRRHLPVIELRDAA